MIVTQVYLRQLIKIIANTVHIKFSFFLQQNIFLYKIDFVKITARLHNYKNIFIYILICKNS